MVWTMVWVVIPVIAIICGFITKWHRTNVEYHLMRMGSDQANDELRETVRRLEARVANLERAVTTAEQDRKYASL